MMDELLLLSGTTPEEVAARQEIRRLLGCQVIRVESAVSYGEHFGQCSVASEIEHCWQKKP